MADDPEKLLAEALRAQAASTPTTAPRLPVVEEEPPAKPADGKPADDAVTTSAPAEAETDATESDTAEPEPAAAGPAAPAVPLVLAPVGANTDALPTARTLKVPGTRLPVGLLLLLAVLLGLAAGAVAGLLSML